MDAGARALRAMSRKEGEFTLLLDAQFDIVWHSESLSGILGWGDVSGQNATEFVHPDDLALAFETMLRAQQSKPHMDLDPGFAPESADIRVVDVHGEWHSFETTSWNRSDDPIVRGVLVTCRRVHNRSDLALAIERLGTGAGADLVLQIIARLTERSLGGGEIRVALAWNDGMGIRIETALDEPPLDPALANVATATWQHRLTEPQLVTDLHDPILGDAGTTAMRLGYKGAFVVPIEAPSDRTIIGSMVAWGTSTVDFHIATQSPLHVALRLAALTIADSHIKGRLRWEASHDPLSGLMNRGEFERRLKDASCGDLILLYIDLDNFKPVNDEYGHAVGDLVLREAARRIAAAIGPRDIVGRLGGDEFAVMCVGESDVRYGSELGDRIVEAIRVPLIADGRRLQVGASVGVAVGSQPLIPALLAQRADEALYRAKHSGKNTVCVAS